MADKPLNILLITSDQQHYSTLGVVNDRIQTPALDRLCKEGMRFDRAYCPNPTCTPTRATVLTGLYPSQHGAWSLGTKLMENVPTVGDRFRRAGYDTSLIGKAHFQPLTSTDKYSSLESYPILHDLDYWRNFHGPWYGFEHVETARMHGDESHVGQHYAIWMEEKGLTNWRDYFAIDSKRGEKDYDQDGHWTLPQEYHYTTWTAERTIARIEKCAAEDKPFFCWSSFHDPHPPYIVPEPWASMYDPEDMQPGSLVPGEHESNPLHFQLTQDAQGREKLNELYWEDQGMHGFHSHLSDEQWRKKSMAIYYGMTSFMDQQIGRILEALDRTGQAENTLVVFSTDHGHFLGQHGLIAKGPFHYEDMIRIPFIVRWPGKTPPGQVSQAIQNLVDLPQTFLTAAGLEEPAEMAGVNQTETWTGAGEARNWSITENRHTFKNVHLRTYVNQRYKITVYRSLDEGELFDLEEDPRELNNLWSDPSAVRLKASLLQEFLQATMSCEPTPMPRIAGA